MLWIAYKDAFLRRTSLHGGSRHLEKAREVLGRFTRYCDPTYFGDVTQAVYEGYIVRRKSDVSRKTNAPVSIATLNGEIRYLNTCFEYARQLKLADLGVSEDWRPPRIKRLRQPKRRPRTIAPDVMDRVFDSCKFAKQPQIPGCTPGQWWQTLFLVNYVTCMRCEALLGIPRPTDEQLAHNELLVPAEVDKSGTERLFWIPDEVVAAIRRMPAKPGERLFNWPFGRRYFYTIADKFQKAAGLTKSEKALTHDFRRSGCTQMLRGGANVVTVQRQMGHSDPKILADSYAGDITDQQIEAVRTLPLPKVAREMVSPDRQLQFSFS